MDPINYSAYPNMGNKSTLQTENSDKSAINNKNMYSITDGWTPIVGRNKDFPSMDNIKWMKINYWNTEYKWK